MNTSFNFDLSPISNKFGDVEKKDKRFVDPSPKIVQPSTLTPKVVSHPIVESFPTPMTTSLRKRKPIPVDKIDIPLPQLRPKKQPPKSANTHHSDEDSHSGHEFETELPPERQAMLSLLVKIMKHDIVHLNDLEGFSPVDLEILRSIVKRKYGININPRDFDDKKKLILELNSLDNKQKGAKRSEENNKLVFKRAIKALISSYKNLNYQEMKDMKKKEYECIIVRHFFGGIPIPESRKKNSETKDNEKKPYDRSSHMEQKYGAPPPPGIKGDEKIRRFVINPNTINSKYIRFVFKSVAFKEFFDDFVTNHFIADYRKNRPNKIRKIIESVYADLSSKKAKQFQVQNATNYIEKNPKFKLPWSDKELQKCIKSTQEFIQRVFRVRDEKRKRR